MSELIFPQGAGTECYKIFRVDHTGKLLSALVQGPLCQEYARYQVIEAPLQGFFVFDEEVYAAGWLGRLRTKYGARRHFEVWACIGWERQDFYKVEHICRLKLATTVQEAQWIIDRMSYDGDTGPHGTRAYKWIMPVEPIAYFSGAIL